MDYLERNVGPLVRVWNPFSSRVQTGLRSPANRVSARTAKWCRSRTGLPQRRFQRIRLRMSALDDVVRDQLRAPRPY